MFEKNVELKIIIYQRKIYTLFVKLNNYNNASH